VFRLGGRLPCRRCNGGPGLLLKVSTLRTYRGVHHAQKGRLDETVGELELRGDVHGFP